MNLHTKETVRDCFPSWPTYQKKTLTHALRIEGAFEVETSEGKVTCLDGYLAVDARGFPYPIAKEEFEKIYVLLDGRRFL